VQEVVDQKLDGRKLLTTLTPQTVGSLVKNDALFAASLLQRVEKAKEVSRTFEVVVEVHP